MMVFGLIALFVINEGRSINIDDKLDSPFSSDCFKRISIGERLIAYDVTRTIERTKVKDCEEECNIYRCTFFSFGIAAAGNGTCELSTQRDISRRQDADYDLYQRTNECAQGKPTGYEEACYRRLLTGSRLDERFIRHSLPCDALEACQHQCSIEKHFQCQGFNIRLDKQNPGRGICELSAIPSSYLHLSGDFRPDPEFDYYEKDYTNNSPNCGYINEVINVVPKNNADERAVGRPGSHTGGPYHGGDSYGPWSTGHGSSDHGPWGSHGYGSGFYVSNNPSRSPPPLFRPDTQYNRNHYGSGGDKRYHSHHPNEIPDYRFRDKGRTYPVKEYNENRNEAWRYPRDKVPGYVIIDAEDRRNFRQEYNDLRPNYPPHRPPAPVYGPPNHLAPGPNDNFHGIMYNDIGHEVCFQRAHAGYRLDESCIRNTYRMPSVLDCEQMCMKANFKCTGYAFRYSQPHSREPNCALTDFTHLNPKAHLVPDRNCDVYSKMPACHDWSSMGDAECFSRVVSNQRIQPNMIAKGLNVPRISDCELECLRSNYFTCRSFTFRYTPGVIGEPIENCFLSDWPVSALHPHRDFVPAPGFEVYERGSFGHGCELDSGPPWIGPNPTDVGHPFPHDKFQWNREETWKHFTVRGWPCRIGTTCQLNPDAGFWSCEVEGGDRAQWDYCCRPRHSCGFSRGFNYPWCYVGEAGPDQWRPCNEQYYPDFGNRNPYPGHGHGHNPHDHYGPPRGGNRPWNYGQNDYGPPSYWPISYLYNEPPPNETYSWVPDRHFHGQEDDSPKIRFKNPHTKTAYPKATVHKLDVKDNPPAKDPGEEMSADEEKDDKNQGINPRYNYSKKLEMIDKVPDSDLKYNLNLGTSNCGQEHIKNEVEQFSSTTLKPQQIDLTPFIASNSTAVLYSSKRQLSEKLQELKESEVEKTNSSNIVNSTDVNNNINSTSDKTKDVIQMVEKIIEENSKEDSNQTETAKTENLEKESSEHIGYITHYLDFRQVKPKRASDNDSAMQRFLNWSRQKYATN